MTGFRYPHPDFFFIKLIIYCSCFYVMADYSAEKSEIRARTICICKSHPTLPFAYNKVTRFIFHDSRQRLLRKIPRSSESTSFPGPFPCPSQRVKGEVLRTRLSSDSRFSSFVLVHDSRKVRHEG